LGQKYLLKSLTPISGALNWLLTVEVTLGKYFLDHTAGNTVHTQLHEKVAG
jgi:hypothetical protein